MPRVAARLRHGRDRRWRVARLPAPRRHLRPVPGTPGRAPGLGPPCRRAERDHRVPGAGQLRRVGREDPPGIPSRGTEQPPPPAAGALPAFGGYRRGARHLPGDRRRATGVAGFLRDLDGRPAVRRAGGATAAQGKRRRLADARGAAVRDPRRPGQRRPLHGAPADAAGLPFAAVRGAGSDDRLLRFGQGRRYPHGGLGAVPGAGETGGDLPPARGRAAALPWPRRYRRPRRRAGPRGDPVAAAGFGGRALPGHRTGRDDPLQVRLAGHRRTEPQSLPRRGAGSDPDAAAGSRAGLARADGPPGEGRAAGLPQGGARRSAVRRVFPPGHARAGTGPSAAGQPPGQAPRRRGGEPAGDSLDLRLDPDAPDAAGMAWLGDRLAERHRAWRGRAARADARAMAVLHHPHRHAGNGPGQGRRGYRAALRRTSSAARAASAGASFTRPIVAGGACGAGTDRAVAAARPRQRDPRVDQRAQQLSRPAAPAPG